MQPQTGPDLGRRGLNYDLAFRAVLRGKGVGVGWTGPIQFSSCDNPAAWNLMNRAVFLGSWWNDGEEKILG